MNNKTNKHLLKFTSILIGLSVMVFMALTQLVIIVNSHMTGTSEWIFLPFTSYSELAGVEFVSFLTGGNEFEITDGLGRKLEYSSWLMRHLFDSEKLSVGLGWKFLDAMIFFGGFAATFSIYPEDD